MTDQLIYDMPVRDVLAIAQCNRTTLYRWMDAGIFPKPRKIGLGKNGRVRWCRAQVDAWLSAAHAS